MTMKLTYDQAVVLHKTGQLERAECAYRELLDDPNIADHAGYGLGVLLLQVGNADDALRYLKAASENLPLDLDVANALGAAQQQAGDQIAARINFEKIIAVDCEHPKALLNLGVVLYQLKEFESSISMLENAIQVEPKNGVAYYNYSRSLLAFGKLKEAEVAASRALELQPNDEKVNINLGVAQMSLGLAKEAITSYKSVLSYNSVSAEAHHNLAQIYLQLGKFDEGWKAFQWRWKTKGFTGAEVFQAIKRWDDMSVPPKKLLVWTEQGVGDQILYGSMIPDLLNAVDSVLIACSERLVGLFSRSFPAAEVASQSSLLSDRGGLEAITHQIAIGDLGQFFRPEIKSFYRHNGYLLTCVDRVHTLRTAYKIQSENKFLVGISWFSGNPRFGISKSIELVKLASKLVFPNVQLVDLQYGNRLGEIQKARKAGIDIFHDPDINALTDLDGFAAQVKAMDLVITVSNTTAHFAGAMGVPCWVLLSEGLGKFWYWFVGREDSPWYPSVRLFRQVELGVWSQVLRDVSKAFSKRLSTQGKMNNLKLDKNDNG